MQTTTFQGFLNLAGVQKPDQNIINTCVRCGLCLQSCPTYKVLATEPSSPRGRIALIRGVAEGRIAIDAPGFLHQMDECLGCLACQAVCPSGVEYGYLLAAGRAQAKAVTPRRWMVKAIEGIVFGLLFMKMSHFRFFGRILWFYQHSGLQALARGFGILERLGLAELEEMLPELNDSFLVPQGQHFAPFEPQNAARPASTVKRVALLTGCVQSIAFVHVHEATIRTLQVNGCQVVLPKGQGCCGALHAHGGDLERAKQLSRQNIDALESIRPDLIVVNAAGCSHHLKEYAHLLQDDPLYADKAQQLVAKSRDIIELLAELGPKKAQTALPWHVTYQEPCHLAHGQKVISQPRQILAAIPGLKLTEMEDSTQCCGSAGIYNITQPEMANTLLNQKLDHAQATGATIIASANTGCMIQLQAGLKQRDSSTAVKVMHIVEILDAAYRHDGLYGRTMRDITMKYENQIKFILLGLTFVIGLWSYLFQRSLTHVEEER